jgi:hypothetical protein
MHAEPPPPSPRRAGDPGTAAAALDGTLAVIVLVLAAALASFAATNPDLWLNLAAGRLVDQGRFPFGRDPFSAAPGATWVNHGWLFDLLLYLLYRPGGAALVAVKACLVVVMAAVLLGIRRPGGGGLGPAAATTLVLLAASPLLILRPVVASYLLFAVLLLILCCGLDWAPRESKRAKWLLPLAFAVLFALWVNLDGGFVFGLLLLALWLVGAVLQRVFPLGDLRISNGGVKDLNQGHPGLLAAAFAAALIGCLINPYHIHAFRLPQELSALTLPASLRADPDIEPYVGASVLSNDFRIQVGPVAWAAVCLLLAVNLAGFAVNAGGWDWRRSLAWAAFAWLGLNYGRLVPYFAIVSGPVAVLNLQAFFARRQLRRVEALDPRMQHLLATLAAAGRVGLLLCLVVLLALAWPGWLGNDARSAAPSRRVDWRAEPDPTMERLAKRLKSWYDAGELHPGEARGFHYPPSFFNYCAWFCPPEKGILDSRLTAPPEAIAEYLALRSALHIKTPRTPDQSMQPPDPVFNKAGITHIVLGGPVTLPAPPELLGYAFALFLDPARWPAWAIEGRGVICGWRDMYPKLRLDPIRLAVGKDVEPLPDPPVAEPPTPPTIWDRYVAASAPTPPEAYEAGLWLAYREATIIRQNARINENRLTQTIGRIGRLAPTGTLDLFARALAEQDVFAILVNSAGRQASEARSARASAVDAVRAARRAIPLNPDDPEGYMRLFQAYGVAAPDTPPLLGQYTRIVVARQTLLRLKATPFRQSVPHEEILLQSELADLYWNRAVPGARERPLDLLAEALEQVAKLRPQLGPLAGDAGDPNRYKANLEAERAKLEQLQAKLRENRDNWENATGNQPPVRRAAIACQYGLAGEALKVIRDADPKDLNAGAILMGAKLYLLSGDAQTARDWIRQIEALGEEPFPFDFRMELHTVAVQAAAALGDYRSAIEQVDKLLALFEMPARLAAARVVADLILPDAAPAHPLSRAVTLPLWGGIVRQGQLALGQLALAQAFSSQQQDWLILQGLLALEGGDIPLARQRLTEATRSRLLSVNKHLAALWLDLFNSK